MYHDIVITGRSMIGHHIRRGNVQFVSTFLHSEEDRRKRGGREKGGKGEGARWGGDDEGKGGSVGIHYHPPTPHTYYFPYHEKKG